MSFMHEVKYKGSMAVPFVPTHAQPRPGLVEANAALKQLHQQERPSTICVLSVSADMGIKCVDTSFNPPKVVMSNAITEIAHCGVDVSRSEYVSCIVGSKAGTDTAFFCHFFKCTNKDTANKVARAIASACTLAFQARVDQSGPPGGAAAPGFQRGASKGDVKQSFQKSVKATSQRHSIRTSSGNVVALVPKLTDAWFRPSMSRTEVNAVLKGARVGDFIVRESSTQPGDYAVAVQLGEDNIWVGLLISTPEGFQVGKMGSVRFPEITDFVLHFMSNELVKDARGNPVCLRLPQDTSSSQERRPTFKNPPAFGAPGGSPEKFTSAAGPAFGWPSDEEEESPKVSSRKSSGSAKPRGPPAQDDDDEKAAFDAIMNGTLQLEVGDEHAKTQGDETLESYARELFSTISVDDDGCVDGREVRGVLMRSGLDVQVLGQIWQDVDQEQRGKVDFDQFTLILGLISQAQAGFTPSLDSLDIDSVPPPVLM